MARVFDHVRSGHWHGGPAAGWLARAPFYLIPHAAERPGGLQPRGHTPGNHKQATQICGPNRKVRKLEIRSETRNFVAISSQETRNSPSWFGVIFMVQIHLTVNPLKFPYHNLKKEATRHCYVFFVLWS